MECRSADVTVGGIVRGQVVSVHLRSTPRRPSAWVFRSGGANPPGLAGLAVGMGGVCPLHLTSHPVTSARAMRANITTPKHHPPGAEPRARDGAPWVETRPLGVEPRLPGLESRSSPAISAIPMRTGPTQPPPSTPRSQAPSNAVVHIVDRDLGEHVQRVVQKDTAAYQPLTALTAAPASARSLTS